MCLKEFLVLLRDAVTCELLRVEEGEGSCWEAGIDTARDTKIGKKRVWGTC